MMKTTTPLVLSALLLLPLTAHAGSFVRPDLDHDGAVTQADVNYAEHCRLQHTAQAVECRSADQDGDGLLTRDDVAYIKSNLGRTGYTVFPTPERIARHADGMHYVKDELNITFEYIPNPTAAAQAIAAQTGGRLIGGALEPPYQIQYPSANFETLKQTAQKINEIPGVRSATLVWLANPIPALPKFPRDLTTQQRPR